MLVLVRKDAGAATAIVGELYLNGQFICYTLENVAKAIPLGQYRLENSKSPKFKRELPLVYNDSVKANRGIRIHSGNTYKDSAGCILVGMRLDTKKRALAESKLAETMVAMIARNDRALLIVAG